jgi:hypothetical protein
MHTRIGNAEESVAPGNNEILNVRTRDFLFKRFEEMTVEPDESCVRRNPNEASRALNNRLREVRRQALFVAVGFWT